jgi:hypothetical protein
MKADLLLEQVVLLIMETLLIAEPRLMHLWQHW